MALRNSTGCKRHDENDPGTRFEDYVVAIDSGKVLNVWKGEQFRTYRKTATQYRICMVCCTENAKEQALKLHEVFHAKS